MVESKEDKLLTKENEERKRWQEHFMEVVDDHHNRDDKSWHSHNSRCPAQPTQYIFRKKS